MDVKSSMAAAMSIEGAVAAALVDWTSGMTLDVAGGNAMFNIELAAASNSQVVKAKLQVIKALNLNDSIEDILITLGKQYHLIRPVRKDLKLFFYLVLRRDQGNLALARYKLGGIESELEIK
ncbi:MAG TPA: hypothetical protein ACFE0H_00800 [Elainellaceae cyanobacterium]